MITEMTPQFNTMLFSEVYDSVESFITSYNEIGLPVTISEDSAKTLFLLLYGRYGNNPIANLDVNQWKIKLFSVVYQYGPTWERKLKIQERLRGLSEEDLVRGNKVIYNSALNPDTTPGTAALEELLYINNQNTANYKKSTLEGYAHLMALLETDVTEEFINRFKNLFSIMVRPENPLLFFEEAE